MKCTPCVPKRKKWETRKEIVRDNQNLKPSQMFTHNNVTENWTRRQIYLQERIPGMPSQTYTNHCYTQPKG